MFTQVVANAVFAPYYPAGSFGYGWSEGLNRRLGLFDKQARMVKDLGVTFGDSVQDAYVWRPQYSRFAAAGNIIAGHHYFDGLERSHFRAWDAAGAAIWDSPLAGTAWPAGLGAHAWMPVVTHDASEVWLVRSWTTYATDDPPSTAGWRVRRFSATTGEEIGSEAIIVPAGSIGSTAIFRAYHPLPSGAVQFVLGVVGSSPSKYCVYRAEVAAGQTRLNMTTVLEDQPLPQAAHYAATGCRIFALSSGYLLAYGAYALVLDASWHLVRYSVLADDSEAISCVPPSGMYGYYTRGANTLRYDASTGSSTLALSGWHRPLRGPGASIFVSRPETYMFDSSSYAGYSRYHLADMTSGTVE